MLMLSDREEISRGLAEGLQFKEIGLRLGRDPSVISREVGRHGGRAG
jgi:IS30 family transposase